MTDENEAFLKRVDNLERWYNWSSGLWNFVLNTCKITTLAASLVSIVVSAAVDKDYFAGPGRWIIVAATILTAAASEVLGQLKVRQMENLRETGRIEAYRIAEYARQKLPELANNPEKLAAVKDEIRDMIFKLELSQHRQATSIDNGAQQPQGTSG